MKKVFLTRLFATLITSGCCRDEIVDSYRLNQFDKTLIPYNTYEELKFINEEGNIVIINSQPKTTSISSDRYGPESCRLFETEAARTYLYIPYMELGLDIIVSSFSSTAFTIRTLNQDASLNASFDLACVGLFDRSIEERFTNISIGEFNFQNIVVFQDCQGYSPITQIIYSIENGVEFTEFSDGKWLKLDHGNL